MMTTHTHIAALRARHAALDADAGPHHIHGLSGDEYLRRLATVAAKWPAPSERTRTVDLRRPASPPPLPAPSWAPLLVSAVQAALARPVIVRGMP